MNNYWDYNTFYDKLPAPYLKDAQSIIYVEIVDNIPNNFNKNEYKEIIYNYIEKNYVNVRDYDEWNYFYKKTLKNNLLLYINNISYKKSILNLKLSFLKFNIDIIEYIIKYI